MDRLKRTMGVGLVALLAFVLVAPVSVWALAVEYNRNGECYLLIGDVGPFTGVYRMNDPAQEGFALGYLYNPGESIGISVDLSRNVYTFSEVIDPGYTLQPGNIKRQVVDGGSTVAHTNWGYHANLHYDHRNNYGAGQAGRPIYRTTGSTLSAGPGTVTTAPNPSPLPPGDTVFARTWYEIPNGSWYSTWHTTSAVGAFSTAYKVYWDRVEGKNHTWSKWIYANGVGPLTNAGAVAVTADLRVNRAILNGCLDGCGGATGAPTWNAQPLYTSIAFTPQQGVNPSRTYLYTRERPNANYTISMNGSAYLGSIIGNPSSFYIAPNEDKGSRWVAVSSKTGADDWVYVLGTDIIKAWYLEAVGVAAPGTTFINAVSVSNQWNQKGGIVFAFDKGAGVIYQFERDETSPTPITAERYNVYTSAQINGITDIDDIKADGFGNLYFAKTTQTPTNAPADFNMNNDVFFVASDSSTWGRAIFRQVFAKEVFQRAKSTGITTSQGTRVLGYRYFARSFNVASASALPPLLPPSYANFETRMLAATGTWSGWGSANPPFPDTYNPLTTPQKVELAVINVPTPPPVNGFGYNSHVDIVGPYFNPASPTTLAYPYPNLTSRHTDQSQYLVSPMPNMLSPGQIYGFMVENYPLRDGPQDPNAQTDWNGNGYLGGFITSLKDPWPSTDAPPGRIRYRWHLWSVEDPFATPMTPAADPPLTPVSAAYGGEVYGFYSPVGGKYILTCQVKYDWYNYDLLPFGALFSDRETVLTTDTLAQGVGQSSLITDIQTKFPFMAWATMSPVLYSSIVSDDTWAAIPISVSTNTSGIPTATLTASVERADLGLGFENEWAVKNVHYVFSGRGYRWRMHTASQSNMFWPISTDNNPATNYVVYQLTTPGEPLYANGNPSMVFRNQVGDVAWDEPNATLGAYIIASMPSGTTKTYTIFGGSQEIQTPVATFGTAIIDIPTDPIQGTLEIKARRRFKYKVWPYDTVRGIYYSPFWIPNYLTITAQTKVCVIDNKPPRLEEELTNEGAAWGGNLFGFTGDPLKAGALPGLAGVSNPTRISFLTADDNPWENADVSYKGIINPAVLAANIAQNALYDGRSSYDIRPIFARDLNRSTILHFSSVLSTTTYNPGTGTFNTGGFESWYTSRPTHTESSPNAGTYLEWTHENTPENAVVLGLTVSTTTYSYVRYEANVTDLKFSREMGQLVNRVPQNWANNKNGYRPYEFDVWVTDSSGNFASYPLNICLNVRDNIAPIPWATLTEHKNKVANTFPLYAEPATSPVAVDAGLVLIDQVSKTPNSYPSTIHWTPLDATFGSNGGTLGNSGDFGMCPSIPRVLIPLTSPVTKNISVSLQANLVSQIQGNLSPQPIEDNVEFTLSAGGGDNSGTCVNNVTISYLKPDGTTVDSWTAIGGNAVGVWKGPLSGAPASPQLNWAYFNTTDHKAYTYNGAAWQVLPPYGTQVFGVFRGLQNDFPIAFKVSMAAYDDAKDWNYLVRPFVTPVDPRWFTFSNVLFPGAPSVASNTRTLSTTIPVYGTRTTIRTLDKSLENK